MKEKQQFHTHKKSDEPEYEHTHDHEHSNDREHGHKHSHKNTKAVLNRISRASGHLEAVKQMVKDGRDCSEVLIQLSAVIAALTNTSKIILKDHMENCILNAVQ